MRRLPPLDPSTHASFLMGPAGHSPLDTLMKLEKRIGSSEYLSQELNTRTLQGLRAPMPAPKLTRPWPTRVPRTPALATRVPASPLKRRAALMTRALSAPVVRQCGRLGVSGSSGKDSHHITSSITRATSAGAFRTVTRASTDLAFSSASEQEQKIDAYLSGYRRQQRLEPAAITVQRFVRLRRDRRWLLEALAVRRAGRTWTHFHGWRQATKASLHGRKRVLRRVLEAVRELARLSQDLAGLLALRLRYALGTSRAYGAWRMLRADNQQTPDKEGAHHPLQLMLQRCLHLAQLEKVVGAWRLAAREGAAVDGNAAARLRAVAHRLWSCRELPWPQERMRLGFLLWKRYARFKPAWRAGGALPAFQEPCPHWEAWVASFQRRKGRAVQAWQQHPCALLRRLWRRWGGLVLQERADRALARAQRLLCLRFSCSAALQSWARHVRWYCARKPVFRQMLQLWRGWTECRRQAARTADQRAAQRAASCLRDHWVVLRAHTAYRQRLDTASVLELLGPEAELGGETVAEGGRQGGIGGQGGSGGQILCLEAAFALRGDASHHVFLSCWRRWRRRAHGRSKSRARRQRGGKRGAGEVNAGEHGTACREREPVGSALQGPTAGGLGPLARRGWACLRLEEAEAETPGCLRKLREELISRRIPLATERRQAQLQRDRRLMLSGAVHEHAYRLAGFVAGFTLSEEHQRRPHFVPQERYEELMVTSSEEEEEEEQQQQQEEQEQEQEPMDEQANKQEEAAVKGEGCMGSATQGFREQWQQSVPSHQLAYPDTRQDPRQRGVSRGRLVLGELTENGSAIQAGTRAMCKSNHGLSDPRAAVGMREDGPWRP